jgi:hypothetical protein
MDQPSNAKFPELNLYKNRTRQQEPGMPVKQGTSKSEKGR